MVHSIGSKSERVLEIYARLINGEALNKQALANQYNVSSRSIQRDMESLRCFISNQMLSQNIVFDIQSGGYRLVDTDSKRFSANKMKKNISSESKNAIWYAVPSFSTVVAAVDSHTANLAMLGLNLAAQIGMVIKLDSIFDLKITKAAADGAIRAAAATLVGRTAVKLISGVGWAVSGAVAGITTQPIGGLTAIGFAKEASHKNETNEDNETANFCAVFFIIAYPRRKRDFVNRSSMSRVAHCIDNGPMEGFWGLLKRKRYYGRRFTSKRDLVQMIEDYIRYYNTRRVQRNLGVLTPMEKHELSLAT